MNVGITIGALGNMLKNSLAWTFILDTGKINLTQSQGQPHPGAFNACSADEDREMQFKVSEKAGKWTLG